MKHYTSAIPYPLMEKLKEKGMPTDYGCNQCEFLPPYERTNTIPYGFAFDWLMSNRRITIVIEPSFHEPYLGKVYNKDGFVKGFDGNTWHEAAEKAIEKALTLI